MTRNILLIIHKVWNVIDRILSKLYIWFALKINGISCEDLRSNGRPFFRIHPNGNLFIGHSLRLNNGKRFNVIGYTQPCVLFVGEGAMLKIGNNVGLSQASIICHYNIEIGNNVKLGGGVKVFDTDFHSLSPDDRLDHSRDMLNKKKSAVKIGNNVFVGAGSIILKAVEIGDNSVVGAGSVVTKSIPTNQIWAGNPAKFIRSL